MHRSLSRPLFGRRALGICLAGRDCASTVGVDDLACGGVTYLEGGDAAHAESLA
jgi:hypothetical protein